MHAVDRPLQLLLLRAAGQGRLCEVLADDEVSVGVDRFARTRGFAARAKRSTQSMSASVAALLDAYCEGVRTGLRMPWELRLVGVPRSFCTWDPADSLMAVELMSYVGLASLQEDLQRVLIDAVRQHVSLQKLAQWWHPHLDSLDEDLAGHLRALDHWDGVVDAATRSRLERTAPAMARASNAWAVAGHRTVSGKPLFACDPHLEASRLPAIWSEVVLEGEAEPGSGTGGSYAAGITVPGVPALVMGRTDALAFGFTYGFLDSVDFFVEEVAGSGCRRDGGTDPLGVREELIRRKRSPDQPLRVRENALGVLEDDGNPVDGLFLCRAWAGARADWAAGLEALDRIARIGSVDDAVPVLQGMPLSANWVLADCHGDVGWCMGGSAPIRPDGKAGLAPARGWDSDKVWSPGLRAGSELPRGGPDARGVVVSANDPRPTSIGAGAVLVDAAMGSDRLDRLVELLAARDKHDVRSFVSIQRDCLSVHGQRWRERLRQAGVLSRGARSRAADEVARWDGVETASSRAADWMELFWEGLLKRVFGRALFGEEMLEAVREDSSVAAMYWAHFDDAIARHGAAWSGLEDLGALCRDVWRDVERLHPRRRPASSIVFRHVLFGGRIPKWLGFDRGPFPMDGGRSTVHQVQKVVGPLSNAVTVGPSARLVCDLGQEGLWTNLAGGARDRRFSRYYVAGVDRWLSGVPVHRVPRSGS